MPAPAPMLRVRPRRFSSPHPAFARARLEPIHQSLYSARRYAAAVMPASGAFFQYAIGGQLAGDNTVQATAIHTNLEGTAAALTTPKLFLVTGVRILPTMLNEGLTDLLTDTAYTTSAAAITANDSFVFEDLVRIIYGTTAALQVGEKKYARGPSFLFPGNSGIDGGATDALATTVAASANRRSVHSFFNAGRYFAMDRYPALIPSNQNFSYTLDSPQATPPTLGAARMVYVILDGILGRETQ